ncbi:flippase [Pedobacter arcticus]|uniref:flippase n=1 Tax=Pedobacter arcticus TaxID=752140 RepID=UPI0018730FD0|nr:flippase [Pedobacter arcticus]
MSTKKKALTNMGALVIVQLLNYVLPIVTIPIIVRIIGPSNFGSINYISSIVAYFVLFIGYSFELSASRSIAMNQGDQAKLNRIFSKVLFTKILLFIISTVIFAGLIFYSQNLRNDLLLSIYTYLICVASIFDCNYLYTAKQDLKQVALFNLIAKVVLNVSFLYFIRQQGDYILQPLLISISQIVVAVGSFYWAIRLYTLKIIYPGLKAIYRMLWEDKTLFFHSFAHTVYTTINIIFLGYFSTLAEVGFYTAGWKLIILIQALLISPLGVVLFPIIGQAFGTSKTDGIAIIQKMVPIIIFSTLAIAFGILMFGGLTVRIFYGDKFLESILIFKILAFMPMMLALNMLFGIQTMVNLKMDKKFFLITLSAALINVVLNLGLIKYLGSPGAAISWFLTETYCAVAMYIILVKSNIHLFRSEYFTYDILRINVLTVKDKIKDKLTKKQK